MTIDKKEEEIQKESKLRELLWKEKTEELNEVLAYWEMIKKQWNEKKKEFWKSHNSQDLRKLLKYMREHRK